MSPLPVLQYVCSAFSSGYTANVHESSSCLPVLSVAEVAWAEQAGLRLLKCSMTPLYD